MRRVLVRNAAEGQVLALPVTNERGVAVVQKDVRLTSGLIERLRAMDVQRIFVEEPGFRGVECQEGLDPVTYSKLSGFLRQVVDEVRSNTYPKLTHYARDLNFWSQAIVNELEKRTPSFLLYPNEGGVLHRWIARVVNVALLGAQTYLSIGGRQQAQHMVTAALLQDLGLWRLDENKLLESYKSGSGPADEFHDHVPIGLRLAHTIPGLSSYVKAIVAQHHERSDGTGYPKGLSSDQIHPLARVMAVADAYAAQTQREEEPLLPHDAMEWLMAGVGFEFDHVAVRAFRNAVHLYPVGAEVELDSNERGVVTGVRGALAARPTVRILWDADGQPTDPYYEVDLAQQSTQTIIKIY